MDRFYNFFRWLKNWIEKNPVLFFILVMIVFFTWLSNIIISNEIDVFSDRPNVKIIINYLSISFTLISGVYMALGFIYSRINKIDESKRKDKYRNIEEQNKKLLSELSLKEKSIRQNCREILKKVFEKFCLDSSCRITLFYCQKFSRNPEYFHILERYSTGGRQDHFQPESNYMIDIGVIGLVWTNRFHHDVGNCPAYPESGRDRKIASKRKEYLQYQEKHYQITMI